MSEKEALRIIDEYLEEVAEELPEEIKSEVIEELRTHLIEMVKDMGGLTVANAKRAIEEMGDPKKLAREFLEVEAKEPTKKKDIEFSFKIGDKQYKFGFSIDQDLLDNIYNIMKVLMTLVLIGFIIRISVGLLFYPLETDISGIIIDALKSLIMIFVLFHVALWILSQLSSEQSTYRKEVKRIVKERKRKVREEKPANKPEIRGSGLLIGGSFTVIIGVFLLWLVEYISRIHTLTWVTKLLYASLSFMVLFNGVIIISRAFSYLINGEDSPFLALLGDISSVFLIPSLLVINIYPEELQYPLPNSISEYENFSGFVRDLQFAYVPSQYITLVQLLSILLVVLITVSIVYYVLKYNKEKKDRYYQEILKSHV